MCSFCLRDLHPQLNQRDVHCHGHELYDTLCLSESCFLELLIYAIFSSQLVEQLYSAVALIQTFVQNSECKESSSKGVISSEIFFSGF